MSHHNHPHDLYDPCTGVRRLAPINYHWHTRRPSKKRYEKRYEAVEHTIPAISRAQGTSAAGLVLLLSLEQLCYNGESCASLYFAKGVELYVPSLSV